MKKLTLLISLLFAQVTCAQTGLYTTDSNDRHAISEMKDILERITDEHPEKNIVFYVHGRTRNVEKELARIETLEKSYDVKVVLFSWNAWSSLLSRPTKNAQTASTSLNEAFKGIRDFKESNPEYFEHRKINLLCHSMGNLVLQNATMKYSNDDREPIFENYVSVGADVPLIGHKEWLSKFNLARNKNIFMNNRDIVLLLSYGLDLKARNPASYRLGLGFDNYPGKRDQIKEKLVKDATYIDLSGMLNTDHGYFLPKSSLLFGIFAKLTNGHKFDTSFVDKSLSKVKVKKENNIFYIIKKLAIKK